MLDQDKIILKKWIKYFDFTASWLWYTEIEDKISKVLETYANTHSEVWYNASLTTKYYEDARDSLRKSLAISDDFFLIPCWNWSTQAIKKFQELMWLYIPPYTAKRINLQKHDIDLPLVIVWPFEHHSNEISFREWLCETLRIPLKHWKTDLEYLEDVLKSNKWREIIWSFSVASNVTWILNPVEKIYKLFKKYNWIVAFDCASSSPYMNLDCNFYDALFLSPHKCLWWPWSCGLLVIRKSICEQNNQKPTFAWGWTVDYVSKSRQDYVDDLELREDVWTPWILQFIKASLAYELRNKYWLDFIKTQEDNLKKYFCSKIRSKIKNLKLYCHAQEDKLAIFSLNVWDISPYKIADTLSSKFGIQTRAGCSCAWPYGHDLLQLPDWIVYDEKPWWLRISIHYLHEEKDIDFLVDSLEQAILDLS